MDDRNMKAMPERPAGVCELATNNRKMAMAALEKAERIREILIGPECGDACEKEVEPNCLLLDMKKSGCYMDVLVDCLNSILEILN